MKEQGHACCLHEHRYTVKFRVAFVLDGVVWYDFKVRGPFGWYGKTVRASEFWGKD